MKSFHKSLVLASALLTMAAALPLPSAFAADASASPTASPAAKKVTKFPIHGKVVAVDVSAMTFTLSGKTPRVFAVTASTKIVKNGQPASLSDAVVGDEVGGYTEKDADGKLTALSVRFGPKPGAKAKAGASAASAAAESPSTTGASTTTAGASATPKAKAKHTKKAKASPSPSASPAA